MNGNNEKKDVKQTPNEQQEKVKRIIERSIHFLDDPELLIKSVEAVKERDAQIKEALSGLSKQIGCEHASLKGENAAINHRLAELEYGIKLIHNRLSWLDEGETPPEKPEPQPETVEQPAENETAKSDKPTEKPGSGL